MTNKNNHRPDESAEAKISAWITEAVAEQPEMQGWIDLMVNLRAIAEADRAATDNPGLPAGLPTSAGALHHLVSFLQQQPHFMRRPEDLAPIMRLYSGVLDLMQRRTSAMFKPARGKGNPGNPIWPEVVKGTSARAMSELMQSGMSRKAAARAVADACRGFQSGRNVVTASTVERWREMVEQGDGPGAPKGGAALYAYRKKLPAEFGDTPAKRGERLVGEIRKLAATHG